jgi:hypothetical protein
LPPLHALPTSPAARPRERVTRRTGAAAVLVAVALAAGGCGGSSSSSPATGPSSTTAAGTPPVTTTVALGHVVGDLKKKYHHAFKAHQKSLRAHVGKAVDAWLDGAFVGVSYPTSSFPTAFSSFTPQAAQDAGAQKQLMTNATLGPHIDGVTATRRHVSLDVLAPKGHVAGVTAHVVLKFTTSGQTQKKVTVTGRLFLTKDAQGDWQIFGYDVSKGAR